MIEKVSRYQSPDGKLHETLEKAQEYVTDQAREVLDKSITPLLKKGKLSASDRYTLVMTILPDYEALKNLFNDMRRVIGYETRTFPVPRL
jgi:hypothetical protein